MTALHPKRSRWIRSAALAQLAVLSTWCPWGEWKASPLDLNRALIQSRGLPLQPGRFWGNAELTLERAEGGDTPVLTFSSEGGPVRLLLDTGAASAMVSPALVQRLRLRRVSLTPEQFSLLGGGEGCELLELSKTRLPLLLLSPGSSPGPPLRLQGMEALVLPVVALPRGVDGVVGAPTLRQVPFVIDPLGEKLFFGAAALGWRQGNPLPPMVIPLNWRHGVPRGGIRLEPSPESPSRMVNALMDTGAEGLFLTPRLAGLLRPRGAPQPARLMGVCGEQQVLRQRFAGIGLAPEASANPTVEAILTSNPVFASLGVEVIVGQELLRFRSQFWQLDQDPPQLEVW